MVNAQVLQGQWNQVRGELKKKWGQLTEDDLRFNNGNIDQLVGKIQQRTGEAREAIEQFLERSDVAGRLGGRAGGRPGRPVRPLRRRPGARGLQPDLRPVRPRLRLLAGHDPREPRPLDRDGLRRGRPAGRRGRHGAAVPLRRRDRGHRPSAAGRAADPIRRPRGPTTNPICRRRPSPSAMACAGCFHLHPPRACESTRPLTTRRRRDDVEST